MNKAANTTPKTFYCGCKYIPQNSGGKIDNKDCFQDDDPQSDHNINPSTDRLHWEHIVPASKIGAGLSCWVNGHPLCQRQDKKTGKMKSYKGRACCAKTDDYFQQASTDLHNLVPSSGWINMRRRDYAPTIIPDEIRQFGRCDFEIDPKQKSSEPASHLRGQIARSYIYMENRWGVRLSDVEKVQFIKWHRTYPPTPREKARANLITTIQGRNHPFVKPDKMTVVKFE